MDGVRQGTGHALQAIERAFAVLRALRDSRGSAGVSTVARATGLPKSTVSRLLVSLEKVGAVERLDSAGNYAISRGLAALADGASSSASIRDLARSSLRQLAADLDESAGLTVPDGGSALYMDHIAPDSAVMTRDWTGMRFPFHTVAGGLAMLMTWSDAAVTEFASAGLEPFTERTVSTARALHDRLAKGRRNGFIWTLGEFDDDINGVAAPIRKVTGEAVAALTVYGPSYRFPGVRDRGSVGRLVRDAARDVEVLHQTV